MQAFLKAINADAIQGAQLHPIPPILLVNIKMTV